jgi:hypothetical protein
VSGQAVVFKVYIENTGLTFYSDRVLNPDGLAHMIVSSAGDPPSEVPEPGMLGLIGGTLLLIGVRRK